MTRPPEPAIRSYFFGKGYRDLQTTLAESWKRNMASSAEHFAKAGVVWGGDQGWLAILHASAGISVVVFGSVFFLLASIVHVAILATVFLLVYLAFSLVYLAERGFLLCKGFFSVCPECHGRNPLPDYFCPGCRAVHRRLVPSSYGILHHTCTCGERLPATFFLGRSELQARCPDCEGVLSRDHTDTKKLFIPVLGGPSVGKTAYLLSASRVLFEGLPQGRDWTCEFLDAADEAEFRRSWEGLDRGTPPSKTSALLPRALNLSVERPNRTKRLLYLYDPAGEVYGAGQSMVEHKYQAYLSGLLFLVDPFALPAVQRTYEEELADASATLRPSSMAPEDALHKTLVSLRENFDLDPRGKITASVAVVISKVDAFDLEERIGEPAVQREMRHGSCDRDSARNRVVRAQLERWEATGLLHLVESLFAGVSYFTCSSLGHSEDGSGRPFAPRRIEESLLWLIEQADPKFFAVPRTRRKAA